MGINTLNQQIESPIDIETIKNLTFKDNKEVVDLLKNIGCDISRLKEEQGVIQVRASGKPDARWVDFTMNTENGAVRFTASSHALFDIIIENLKKSEDLFAVAENITSTRITLDSFLPTHYTDATEMQKIVFNSLEQVKKFLDEKRYWDPKKVCMYNNVIKVFIPNEYFNPYSQTSSTGEYKVIATMKDGKITLGNVHSLSQALKELLNTTQIKNPFLQNRGVTINSSDEVLQKALDSLVLLEGSMCGFLQESNGQYSIVFPPLAAKKNKETNAQLDLTQPPINITLDDLNGFGIETTLFIGDLVIIEVERSTNEGIKVRDMFSYNEIS